MALKRLKALEVRAHQHSALSAAACPEIVVSSGGARGGEIRWRLSVRNEGIGALLFLDLLNGTIEKTFPLGSSLWELYSRQLPAPSRSRNSLASALL